MLEHLRPLATLSALALVFVAAPAMASGRGGAAAQPGPRIVSVPGHGGHGRAGISFHHGHRRGHRHFGRGLFYGGDGGTGVVPVPGVDAEPVGGPPIVIDAAPRNRPEPNLGPQIITIPDSMRPRGGYRHSAPKWAAHRAHRHAWRALAPRHVHHIRRSFAYAWPRAAYARSPIAMHPCRETYFAPLYNTPCGIPIDE